MEEFSKEDFLTMVSQIERNRQGGEYLVEASQIIKEMLERQEQRITDLEGAITLMQSLKKEG